MVDDYAQQQHMEIWEWIYVYLIRIIFMLFSYVPASECADGGDDDRGEPNWMRYDVWAVQLQLGRGRGIEMELNY